MDTSFASPHEAAPGNNDTDIVVLPATTPVLVSATVDVNADDADTTSLNEITLPIELSYDEEAMHKYQIFESYVCPFIAVSFVLLTFAFIMIMVHASDMAGYVLAPVLVAWIICFVFCCSLGCFGILERHFLRTFPVGAPPRTILHADALEHHEATPLSGNGMVGSVKLPYSDMAKIDVTQLNSACSQVLITMIPVEDESVWVVSGMPQWGRPVPASGTVPASGFIITIKGLNDPYLLKRVAMKYKGHHHYESKNDANHSLALVGADSEETSPV